MQVAQADADPLMQDGALRFAPERLTFGVSSGSRQCLFQGFQNSGFLSLAFKSRFCFWLVGQYSLVLGSDFPSNNALVDVQAKDSIMG